MSLENPFSNQKPFSAENVVLNIFNIREQSTQLHIMQVQAELEAEQDAVFSLRRKLIALENERLDVISASNEEVSRLSGEIACLRAELERGEAFRQNLEYELARAKKDALLQKNSAEDREMEIRKLTDELKRKEEKFISDKKTLALELDASRTVMQEEISRFTSILQEKEKQTAALLKERDRLVVEKNELISDVRDKDRTVKNCKAEIEHLTVCGQEQSSNLRMKTQDAEQFKDRITLLEQELFMALKKIESLETAKEDERTSNLQTKYNFELLQSEMKAEKSAKAEALSKLEKLHDHMKQLQESFEDEKLSSSKLQDKLSVLTKDLESVKKHLSAELADKKRLVKSYSQQLEEYQKTANQMKLELGKAKKKQAQLDDAYSNGIRELQELLVFFTKNGSPSSAVTNMIREPVNMKTFCSLVSVVRLLLTDCRQQHEQLIHESLNQRLLIEQLTKDCKSYKQKFSSGVKAYQVSNEALEKSRIEQKQLKDQYRHWEEECRRLQKELMALKTSLTKEQSLNQELRDQVLKVSTKYQSDEQTSSTFVLLLHQLLNTVDAIAMLREQFDLPSGGGTLHKWNDLGLVVNEQVSSLITLLNQEKEKVFHLEELLRQKERTLEQLNVAHDEELAKLTNQQWADKEELQKQYSRKLSEVRSKHKVSVEETWQKLETVTGFQQELEQERSRLQSQLDNCHREHDTLLATCALLCGTLYPLHARCVALTEQRDILCNQFLKFESFKDQVKNLILAISGSTSDAESKTMFALRSTLAPKLRFRCAVICVIAVGRLTANAGICCRIFAMYNVLPGIYSTTICAGNVEPASKTPKDSLVPCESSACTRIMDRLLDWLSNEDLRSMVMSSMEDLTMAMCRLKEGAPGYDVTRLVNITKNCFQNFLLLLPNTFPCLSVESYCDVSGLWLKKGLETSLGPCIAPGRVCYNDSQQLARSLQQELLDFTQRLHSTELERRDLRSKLSHIKHGTGCDGQEETLGLLKVQVASLRDQLQKTISLDKFNQVCVELARSVEQEEHLQLVLKMQKEQLEELAKSRDSFGGKGTEKEDAAFDSGNHVTNLRVELHSKDQLVQRLMRQISILGEEKSSLLTKITDAEHALHTAARDKQSIITYTNALINSLKKLPSAKMECWKPDSLLDFELPNAKPGAELLAIRNLLAAFVEAQNYVLELRSYESGATDDFPGKAKSRIPGDKLDAHFSRPPAVLSTSADLSTKESLRPRAMEPNTISTKAKGNSDKAQLPARKMTERKTKSRLPRHRSLRTRRPTSHRYSSLDLTVDSGGRHVSKTPAAENIQNN